jgi:hypothetical protein
MPARWVKPEVGHESGLVLLEFTNGIQLLRENPLAACDSDALLYMVSV